LPGNQTLVRLVFQQRHDIQQFDRRTLHVSSIARNR
jgi:hypothetical protein